MNMRLIESSCALVIVWATALFAQSASSQRPATVRETGAQSSPVTMTGCVVRQRDSSAHGGSNAPNGGTVADTNAGATPAGTAAAGSVNRGNPGDELLLIVTASRASTSPRSAVPGSSSTPGDTGTIPSDTRAGTTTASPSGTSPSAFHLVFARGANRSSYVGQRVEVTGVITAKTTGAVATDANEVTRAGAATTGTRAEVARDPESHPSADLSDLTVQTIKPVAGRCDTP